MDRLIMLLLGVCLLLVYACDNESIYKYKDSSQCSNLHLQLGLLYPKESIFLYFNDELIFREEIDSLDGYYFSRSFCLEYTDNDSIRILTKYNGKTYLDESFVVEDSADSYELSISYPHPKNWRELFESERIDDYLHKGWGYLSIDSSVRFVNFYPDSVLKHPFDSIPTKNMRPR